MDEKSNRYTISSVEKALDVLELIAEHESLNLIEISQLLDKPKSSLFRIITTLEHRGYVTRSDKNAKYCLGFKALKLSSDLLKTNTLERAAGPGMEELSAKYGDSVNVGILIEEEILYIAVKEGTYPLRFTDVVGTKSPFYATAIGKAIAAHLSDEVLDRILEKSKFVSITPYTITDQDTFKKELEKVREMGVAFDNQEIVEGARCVAAPIFNTLGEVEAAISISGASHRFKDERIREIEKDIKEIAQKISENLGYEE